MIKRIVVWVVLFGAVLSGCGKATDVEAESSPQHSEQKTKPAVKTSLSGQPVAFHHFRMTTADSRKALHLLESNKIKAVTYLWIFSGLITAR